MSYESPPRRNLDKLLKRLPFGRLALSANLAGIALMLISTLCQTSMQASIRSVPGDLHPFVIVFFRNLFGLMLLLIWHARVLRKTLSTERMRLHALRGGVNVLAMLMFFTAVTITPLSEVAALSFTAPLFAALLAIPFLREKARPRRLVVIGIGLAGMLIILRPGLTTVTLGQVLVVLASILWAGALIVIKTLSRTDSPVTITIYMGIFMTPIAGLAAIAFWQTPNLEQFFWLILIGLLGTLAQVSLVGSFRMAEATAVLPFDFFKLIWGSVVGFFMFSEIPDGWTWIGGGVIFASSTYLAYREAQGSSKAT